MSISRVRMIDFVSEESSKAFEKEYIKRALELVPNALNLILTRTGPESLLHIAVYQNQEDVDSSFKATEDFMANWNCLLYTSPSPRDMRRSRMPSSA